MDLNSRIRRRKRSDGSGTLVVDYEALSPVAHPSEPVGRGPVVERLLDYLDPVFEGELPPDAYVWGPTGAGKSAVLTALFGALQGQLSRSGSVIHTSTRAAVEPTPPAFVYVDARTARSTFGLYHAIADGAIDEAVPRRGVGTGEVRNRLEAWLAEADNRALVAVDHLGEPETESRGRVADLLAPFGSSLSWIGVGREPPSALDGPDPSAAVEIAAYRRHDLVDVLTERASTGLAERALRHEQTREIADWAEGNAHDALAGLFGAAEQATARGHPNLRDDDVADGLADVPRPCQSLGRVMALPASRRRVLRVLVDLEADQRASVDAATDAITVADGVDLSAATVKRFLYELAGSSILARLRREDADDGNGRPPSRVEPRFPTAAFRRLQDVQS